MAGLDEPFTVTEDDEGDGWHVIDGLMGQTLMVFPTLGAALQAAGLSELARESVRRTLASGVLNRNRLVWRPRPRR